MILWDILTQRRKTLAFGVEPSYSRYRLRLARYVHMAEVLRREGKPLDILDAGCGRGRLRLYAANVPARWFGLDLQSYRIDIARRVGGYRLTRGSVVELPYRDASFDALVCSHVLEHLPDPESVLREFRRVLRPGGVAIIALPVFTSVAIPLIHAYFRAVAALGVTALESDHETFLTCDQSVRMVGRVFEVEEAVGFRFLRRRIFAALEDWKWTYDLNTTFGRRWPAWTPEVNIVARKRA